MRYKAFISYSHQDEAFAARLHRLLERYRLPRRVVASRDLTGNRLGVIFRDRDELASSASLTDTIREALAASECLIVVCSRASAASRWVNAEVETFRAVRPQAPILTIVPDTEAEGPVAMLFPEALRVTEEPLAADARADGDGFPRAFQKLVAGLLGVRFDELRRREATRRRQRIAAVVAGVVVMGSVAGVLVYQARTAEQEARERRAQADALISYMVDDLDRRLQEYEEVGELDQGLSQALNYFGALDADELNDDTLRKYRVALVGVGSVRIRQGKLEEALENFQRAVELGRITTRRTETDAAGWYELAQHTYYVGEAYWEMQNIEAAAEYIQAALDYARRAAALEPDDVAYRLEVVFGLNNMGAIYTRLKRYDDAITSLEASLAENEAMRGTFPGYLEELVDQELESVSWLAEILPTLGDFEQGFVWHEREISLREQRFDDTGNVHHLARLSDALGYYARTLAAVGRTAEAREALRRKVEISERLIREDPENAFWQERGHLGRVLLATEVFHDGDATAAVSLLDQAESGLENLLAEDRNRSMVELHLAYVASTRAYFALDDPDRALSMLAGAFAILEPRLDDEQAGPLVFDYYLRAVILESAVLRAADKAPDASRLDRALKLMEARGEPEQSVRDAAALGLLELAGGLDDGGAAEFQQLHELGYKSVFFETIRTRLNT